MKGNKFSIGDEVVVHVNTPRDAFLGKVVSVNDKVAEDVWYEVEPYGTGVAEGRTFWHRESKVSAPDDTLKPPADDGIDSWDMT